MRITLNGFELSKQAEGQTPVGQVLVEIKEEIIRSGRIIGEVRIDGSPLPQGWQRRKRLAQPVSMFESLELMMASPEELRRETIENTNRMCKDMSQAAKPLALNFRIGNEVSANLELASLLDNLKLVMAGLDHTSRTPEQNPQTEAIRRRVELAASQFMPALDRIYKAQSSGDYVAIADELEYELPDHLQSWTSLTADLQNAMNGTSKPVNI